MTDQKQPLAQDIIKIAEAWTRQTKNGSMMTKLKHANWQVFNLFHTKKDGSETKAYSEFKKLEGMWLGKTIEILYKEDLIKVEDKDVTIRTIVMIKNENDWSQPEQPEQPSQPEQPVTLDDVAMAQEAEDDIKPDAIPF